VQVIQVQLNEQRVVSAVLHIMEMDASSEDLRARAMNERNPVHSLLFSSQGAMLIANSAARSGMQRRPPGRLSSFSLCRDNLRHRVLILTPERFKVSKYIVVTTDWKLKESCPIPSKRMLFLLLFLLFDHGICVVMMLFMSS